MSFIAEGAVIQSDLARLRRDLHRSPEIGLDLPKTQARVLRELAALDLEITLGERSTSITAVLRGAEPGATVLLRADMDALPIREPIGLEYASTNENMHACGHDMHTAGLVGAARLLAAHRDELAGNVIFMFQPGEEGYGGAAIMIEEGVLDAAGDRPVAAYAIHVGPGPLGAFWTRSGAVLASSSTLGIEVHGAGGHGSRPDAATDPVPALAEIITALQVMVTRRFSIADPIVLTVTQLEAGSAINVIPSSARLGATVRALSNESVERLIVATKQIADGIASAHGCTATVNFEQQYPVTINDIEETRTTIATLGRVFGADRVTQFNVPGMGSEDFSYVLAEIPGSYVMLTCSPPGTDPGTAGYAHSPELVLDDSVLGDQAAALAQLAFSRLSTRQS